MCIKKVYRIHFVHASTDMDVKLYLFWKSAVHSV